jgi:hypothetical protein
VLLHRRHTSPMLPAAGVVTAAPDACPTTPPAHLQPVFAVQFEGQHLRQRPRLLRLPCDGEVAAVLWGHMGPP